MRERAGSGPFAIDTDEMFWRYYTSSWGFHLFFSAVTALSFRSAPSGPVVCCAGHSAGYSGYFRRRRVGMLCYWVSQRLSLRGPDIPDGGMRSKKYLEKFSAVGRKLTSRMRKPSARRASFVSGRKRIFFDDEKMVQSFCLFPESFLSDRRNRGPCPASAFFH